MKEKNMQCHRCHLPFTPNRANQVYCSRTCQKNATRPNRKYENRQRNLRHYERANEYLAITECLPDHLLPSLIADLLERSIKSDKVLKNILTDPKLLGSWGRPTNIARVVDNVCRILLEMSSIKVIRDNNTEAIEALRNHDYNEQRYSTERPCNWDYRLLLPASLTTQWDQEQEIRLRYTNIMRRRISLHTKLLN